MLTSHGPADFMHYLRDGLDFVTLFTNEGRALTKALGPVYGVSNLENSFSLHPGCSSIITGDMGYSFTLCDTYQPDSSPANNLEASQWM